MTSNPRPKALWRLLSALQGRSQTPPPAPPRRLETCREQLQRLADAYDPAPTCDDATAARRRAWLHSHHRVERGWSPT